MTGIRGKRGGSPAGGRAWANWPPDVWESPTALQDGSDPSLYKSVGPSATVGDWTLCHCLKWGIADYLAIARDGSIAPWNIDSCGIVSDKAIVVVRLKESGYDTNFLTGGTDSDGMPKVLLPEWLPFGMETADSYSFNGFREGLARYFLRFKTGDCTYGWIRRKDGKPLALRKWSEGGSIPDSGIMLASASDFSYGFAAASRKDADGNAEHNWYDAEGTPLLKGKWAEMTGTFAGGWGWMKKNGKYNFVDTDGRLLSDVWFDSAGSFADDGGPACIKSSDGRYRALYGRNADGGPDLSQESVKAERVNNFSCGIAVAETSNGSKTLGMYVDEKMKPISQLMFDFAQAFSPTRYKGAWTTVALYGNVDNPATYGHYNLIGKDGRLLFSSTWPVLITEYSYSGANYISADYSTASASKTERYIFRTSDDWKTVDEAGSMVDGPKPVPMVDDRIMLCNLKSKSDDKKVLGLCFKDSHENPHIICSLDGKWGNCM